MVLRFSEGVLVGLVALGAMIPSRADDPVLPTQGYPASRYQDLWTHSPFMVATAEAPPDSPDYELVGIAFIDGVSYASIIEKKTQYHFLLSTDQAQPIRGLTLVSLSHGTTSHDYRAIIRQGEETLSLALSQGSAASAPSPTPANGSQLAADPRHHHLFRPPMPPN